MGIILLLLLCCYYYYYYCYYYRIIFPYINPRYNYQSRLALPVYHTTFKFYSN